MNRRWSTFTCRQLVRFQLPLTGEPAPGIQRIFADEIEAKTAPSIRRIKEKYQCGQNKAELIQRYVEAYIAE